jgi:hypothetical protein
MARYYLIPYETDKNKLGGSGFAPKYTEYLGKSRGVTDWENRTGNKYYIVIIDDDKQDMSTLEKQADVLKIDVTNLTKKKISTLGISVSKSPTWVELQTKLTYWLIGEQKRMDEL